MYDANFNPKSYYLGADPEDPASAVWKIEASNISDSSSVSFDVTYSLDLTKETEVEFIVTLKQPSLNTIALVF